MNTFVLDLIDSLRGRIGAKLLAWAMQVLPEHAWERHALTRSLEEQREYERYVGYTQLLGGAVLPFRNWLYEWRGMVRLRKARPGKLRRVA